MPVGWGCGEQGVDVVQQARARPSPSAPVAAPRPARRRELLDQRVPRPAPRALAGPLGVGRAALGAGVHGLRPRHGGIMTEGCHGERDARGRMQPATSDERLGSARDRFGRRVRSAAWTVSVDGRAEPVRPKTPPSSRSTGDTIERESPRERGSAQGSVSRRSRREDAAWRRPMAELAAGIAGSSTGGGA